jgi:hypothetical protein
VTRFARFCKIYFYVFCDILSLMPTTKDRIMPIFRNILMFAANRVASDPKARAKVAKVVDHEIKPRAKAAWHRAQPAVSNIVAGLERFADDPEARAKVAKVVDHEIKPRAKAAWHRAQPAVSNIVAGLARFAGDPNPNDVAQPATKNSRESSKADAFKRDLAKKVGGGRLWLWK